MIPKDCGKKRPWERGNEDNNAGQNTRQLHFQESLPDVERLPWGRWKRWQWVGVGVGQGLSPQSFILHGDSHSELGEAAESPSSGSCP